MAEARACRNQGKFSRLRAMADRDWSCSKAGDLGLALWNKRAVDCVYEFVVSRVSRSFLWVRFVGDDADTKIVPNKMPVVTTHSLDLMQELRAECRVMWPKLFLDSDEYSDDQDKHLQVFEGYQTSTSRKRPVFPEVRGAVKVQRTFPPLDNQAAPLPSTATFLTELNFKYWSKSEQMRTPEVTLEQFFRDSGAEPLYTQREDEGWFSYKYRDLPTQPAYFHSDPMFMSEIPSEILQQTLPDEPRLFHMGNPEHAVRLPGNRTILDELREADEYMFNTFFKCRDAIRAAEKANDRSHFPAIQQQIQMLCEAINEFIAILHVKCHFHRMDAMLLDVRNRLSQIDLANSVPRLFSACNAFVAAGEGSSACSDFSGLSMDDV